MFSWHVAHLFSEWLWNSLSRPYYYKLLLLLLLLLLLPRLWLGYELDKPAFDSRHRQQIFSSIKRPDHLSAPQPSSQSVLAFFNRGKGPEDKAGHSFPSGAPQMPSWYQLGKLYIIIIIIVVVVVIVIIKWHPQTLSLKIYNFRWPRNVVMIERAVKTNKSEFQQRRPNMRMRNHTAFSHTAGAANS